MSMQTTYRQACPSEHILFLVNSLSATSDLDLDSSHMCRSMRKPTLWTLRNVSTKISLRTPRRLIRFDTFRLWGIDIQSNDSTEGET